MNLPGNPQPPADIPGVPPPPPKINARRLWLTLLAPSGVMLLVMLALLFFVANDVRGFADDSFFTVTCTILCLATAVAWGFFIHTIYQRFRGARLVLLIVAYPILQVILIVGIFFVGCLGIIAIDGY